MNLKSKLPLLLMAVPAIAGAAQTLPAEDYGPVETLPVYEVVGTPIAGVPEVDGFAGSTTTVGAEQLRELGAGDFAAALRMAPGATISRYNQVGSFGGAEGGAVLLRGLGGSRPGGEIKTLVDGVPKMNGVFNHPLLDLMSVDAADHIDIHSRAAPLDFGNTFAVVNITTARMHEEGSLLRLDAGAGSFGSVHARLDAGIKQGAFDCYLSQGLRRSDGDRPDSGGRLANTLLHLGWTFSPQWELEYVLNHTDNRATDPGSADAAAGTPSTRGEIYETADWLHIATLSHRHGTASGRLRAYWNEGEGNWFRRQFSGGADSLNSWRLYGLRWREDIRPWEGGALIAGADLDFTRGRSRSAPAGDAAEKVFGPATMRLFSPYAGISQSFEAWGVTLTPSAGARCYNHDDFGTTWAPQAGLSVDTGRTRWHAGWSRAVNHPGLEVMAFSQIVNPALGESWRALRPETARQFEAGVRREFGKHSAIALTVFRNDVRNRYVIVPPPPPPPHYLNLESYHTAGAELAAETAPRRNLALFAGLSLLRAAPGDIPYAPHCTFTGGFNWSFADGWFLNIDGSCASSMRVESNARSAGASNLVETGPRLLLNARLARRFTWKAAGISRGEVYVSGENLTDRDYAYRPGYPMPGINGGAGLRLEF